MEDTAQTTPASKKGNKESDSLLVKERLENKERRRNIVHPKNLCFKCHAKPTIAYRNGLVCCKECFKGAVIETHFRSVIRGFLEPSPKNPGKALVLLSGGPSSMSLALMAAETANNKSQSKRKMFINIELLHIDESVFYPWNAQLEPANKMKLLQFGTEMGLKLHWVDLAEKYKLTPETAAEMLESASDRGSSREDIIVYLRNAAIEDFCEQQKIFKLLVGDSALRVSLTYSRSLPTLWPR